MINSFLVHTEPSFTHLKERAVLGYVTVYFSLHNRFIEIYMCGSKVQLDWGLQRSGLGLMKLRGRNLC